MDAKTIAIGENATNLLTRREAAAYLGVREQTLAAWAVSGRYDLPFLKVGGAVRYRRADLDAFLMARTATSTAAFAAAFA